MKKTYMKPVTEQVEVEMEQLMTVSFDGDKGTATLSDDTATGDGMSKGSRNDIWGWMEDEE